MPFIRVIPPSQAEGRLDKLYQRLAAPGGQVDNVLQIHSLRPHSLEGHMALYKAVLHHPRNHLPTWFLEVVGVLVSRLNGCSYCARHHAEGLRRLLDDDERFESMMDALERVEDRGPFTAREAAALDYARMLTLSPGSTGSDDIETLKSTGLTDGEILEINQVTAYFAYANRTVSGLGVNTEGEELGLSPPDSDDPDAWGHG